MRAIVTMQVTTTLIVIMIIVVGLYLHVPIEVLALISIGFIVLAVIAFSIWRYQMGAAAERKARRDIRWPVEQDEDFF